MNGTSLGQQHPTGDKQCITNRPLYADPGLQKKKATEKSLSSSLPLQPCLMNLGLFWSTCQAGIWPIPVPQPPHLDLSPRQKQEPALGPQAFCPRYFAPSWPRQLADIGLCQLILGLRNWEMRSKSQKEGNCGHCSLWLSSAQFLVKETAEHGEDGKPGRGKAILTMCGLWGNLNTPILPFSLCSSNTWPSLTKGSSSGPQVTFLNKG